MVDWKAVAVGFVVIVVAGIVGFSVPILGHAVAGLVGGFAAGYLAGGSLENGAWNGLIAGSISGVIVTLIAALIGGALGLAAGPLGSLVGGFGVLAIGIFLTLIFALDSALGGAVGAWAKA
ncbi:DUF5518 domain-containing protein [Haloferax namakaokahaiae]|uniref:DUF5518 domain-containing protein n=1 Tax=Haloferax namakaokahaiae TaxID=1748331 RepID=A0ABD5ZCA0_9EURY